MDEPSQYLTGGCGDLWEAIVVGGGVAGLSAAVYLGRARRRTLVVDSGKSLALWEPDVQNYFGFPHGISGEALLQSGKEHAEKYGAVVRDDLIAEVARENGLFHLKGKKCTYRTKRLLLATGLFHLPPDIPGVSECLGQSMFFCKDCDAFRVQNKRIAIVGDNNEAAEYALGMLMYSPCVVISTNGKPQLWDESHAEWIHKYEIPVRNDKIVQVNHRDGNVLSLCYANGERLAVDSVFTTRGDIFHNRLAKQLGAETDEEGQILVDACMQTSVPGLYSAGCVTPANCQMIIAAGQGATAAQAINRSLFEESLSTHSLRRYRDQQLHTERTVPEVIEAAASS